MAMPFRIPRGRRAEPDSAWMPGDSIPAPEAVQKESDSVWALWDEVSEQHEKRFADTEPVPEAMRLPPEEAGWANTLPAAPAKPGATRKTSAAPQLPAVTLEAAIRFARKGNRVCPRPARWDQFAATLPERKTVRGVQQPPPAVTGAAWAATPERVKRVCFREQLEWAERVGMLRDAMAFLEGMAEDEWLHAGEAP